jgi:hypothetical protein
VGVAAAAVAGGRRGGGGGDDGDDDDDDDDEVRWCDESATPAQRQHNAGAVAGISVKTPFSPRGERRGLNESAKFNENRLEFTVIAMFTAQ